MKFLIIHNRYSRQGGEESVVALQSRLLQSHGHRVITYERRHGEYGRLRSLFTALRNKQAMDDIERIVAQERPQVAIIHNLFPIISAAIIPLLKKNGVRVVMTLHNYRLVCPNGLFYTHGRVCERCGTSAFGALNCALRKCQGSWLGSAAWALRGVVSKPYFKSVDTFLAGSDFQRDKIVGYTGLPAERFVIAPNCIDIDTMPHSTIAERGEFIGFVGRLSPEKGVELLFEVARLLPELKFRVAGEASADFSLMASLPPNVELVGYLDKSELAEFYCSARAILLTSSCYEAFPLSVIEAMYYGATVIAPRWAALPQIVDNGVCGVLYEPCSAKDLALKITENHNTGQAARERVFEKYSSEQYYQNIMRCL